MHKLFSSSIDHIWLIVFFQKRCISSFCCYTAFPKQNKTRTHMSIKFGLRLHYYKKQTKFLIAHKLYCLIRINMIIMMTLSLSNILPLNILIIYINNTIAIKLDILIKCTIKCTNFCEYLLPELKKINFEDLILRIWAKFAKISPHENLYT